MGRKKKFVVESDEKYIDQKKHQMVTYIIGKAYAKKILRKNIKKIVGSWTLSSLGGKTKSLQVTKTLAPPPPPQISNGASLTCWNSMIFRKCGKYQISNKELDYLEIARAARAINGLFGANCSKATEFGPDVDRTLLDRFWVDAKKGIALCHCRS